MMKGREGRSLGNGTVFYAFPEFGNWLGVENGTLVCCPMLVNGEPELESAGEVEEFSEPADFIKVATNFFGHTFWYPDLLQPRDDRYELRNLFPSETDIDRAD